MRTKPFIRGPRRYMLSLCLLALGNCVTQIDVPVEWTGNQPVISGTISTIPDQNLIQVGYTSGDKRLPVPMSGAAIVLIDDLGGQFVYQEDPYNPGNYLLPDVAGIPGRTYHVEVNMDGRSYRSLPEKMPEAAGQVSTHYTFVEEDYIDNEGIISKKYFMKILADVELPTATSGYYLRWEIKEDFLLSPTDFPDPFGNIPPPCFISQNADPQRITLLRGADLNATTLTNQLVASRIVDWTFFERHYMTTYQSSITQDAYDYWKKIYILANQVGSIFDTPPSRVTGNIYNTAEPDQHALGYFQAANQAMHRFFTVIYDIPIMIPARPCTYDNRSFNDYPHRCIECTSVTNSSYRRPSWF